MNASSAGLADAEIPVGPGFQAPFAARIRAVAGVWSAAVGMIADPQQANALGAEGKADLAFLVREMLRDPYGARHAAARHHSRARVEI